jgi:hypothetical protein
MIEEVANNLLLNQTRSSVPARLSAPETHFISSASGRRDVASLR